MPQPRLGTVPDGDRQHRVDQPHENPGLTTIGRIQGPLRQELATVLTGQEPPNVQVGAVAAHLREIDEAGLEPREAGVLLRQTMTSDVLRTITGSAVRRYLENGERSRGSSTQSSEIGRDEAQAEQRSIADGLTDLTNEYATFLTFARLTLLSPSLVEEEIGGDQEMLAMWQGLSRQMTAERSKLDEFRRQQPNNAMRQFAAQWKADLAMVNARTSIDVREQAIARAAKRVGLLQAILRAYVRGRAGSAGPEADEPFTDVSMSNGPYLQLRNAQVQTVRELLPLLPQRTYAPNRQYAAVAESATPTGTATFNDRASQTARRIETALQTIGPTLARLWETIVRSEVIVGGTTEHPLYAFRGSTGGGFSCDTPSGIIRVEPERLGEALAVVQYLQGRGSRVGSANHALVASVLRGQAPLSELGLRVEQPVVQPAAENVAEQAGRPTAEQSYAALDGHTYAGLPRNMTIVRLPGLRASVVFRDESIPGKVIERVQVTGVDLDRVVTLWQMFREEWESNGRQTTVLGNNQIPDFITYLKTGEIPQA